MSASTTQILADVASVSCLPRPFGSVDLPLDDDMYAVVRRAARAGSPTVFLCLDLGPMGERLSVLRAIPNLAVLRPATADEIAQSMWFALERTEGPTLIILCDPHVTLPADPPEDMLETCGAWTVRDTRGAAPELVLLSSGAELAGTLAAADDLRADGLAVRVLSVPWRERFLAQRQATLNALLPPSVPRIVVEDTVPESWASLVAPTGAVLGRCCGVVCCGAVPAPRRACQAERIRAVGHDVVVGAAHGW
jgi:transketolase